MQSKTAVSPPSPNNTTHTHAHIHINLRLPLMLLGLLALTAVFLPDRVWNTLLVGMGGLFAISFGWTWLLARNLRLDRRLRFGWVSIGDRLSEQFELVNEGVIPALWVELRDHSTVPGYNASIVQSLGSNSRLAWRESAVCLRLGEYNIGPLTMRCGDPFCLFTASKQLPAATEIIIHPPIHTELPFALPPGQTSGRARARQRALSATINAAAVRDHRPGDPFRWIHWPTSAHRDALFVRQFDLDAAGDLWLLPDMAADMQLGVGADNSEEHAVLLAASLAAQSLRQTRGTGLATYGVLPQLIHPGVGAGQQWQILRALALVRADGETSLDAALRDLARLARTGSTAVIITANGSPEWLSGLLALRQRGVAAHVILLDRPSFGGAGSSAGLRDAIRRLGFESHIIHRGEIGKPLTRHKQRGHWEFRITPLGKAIAVHNPLEEGK
jgi:uncharacterized protein (DUF58 family)